MESLLTYATLSMKNHWMDEISCSQDCTRNSLLNDEIQYLWSFWSHWIRGESPVDKVSTTSFKTIFLKCNSETETTFYFPDHQNNQSKLESPYHSRHSIGPTSRLIVCLGYWQNFEVLYSHRQQRTSLPCQLHTKAVQAKICDDMSFGDCKRNTGLQEWGRWALNCVEFGQCEAGLSTSEHLTCLTHFWALSNKNMSL